MGSEGDEGRANYRCFCFKPQDFLLAYFELGWAKACSTAERVIFESFSSKIDLDFYNSLTIDIDTLVCQFSNRQMHLSIFI